MMQLPASEAKPLVVTVSVPNPPLAPGVPSRTDDVASVVDSVDPAPLTVIKLSAPTPLPMPNGFAPVVVIVEPPSTFKVPNILTWVADESVIDGELSERFPGL